MERPVRAGETLYRIGATYGVPWQSIAAANNIRAPFTIYTGQRLRIPAATTAGANSPEAAVNAFCTWYLNYAPRQGNPLATRAYRSSPYLSAGLVQKVDAMLAVFDPFLCAQDVPNSFNIRSLSVSSPQARAVVMTSFPNHGFTVALQSTGGAWKMTDVTCEVR